MNLRETVREVGVIKWSFLISKMLVYTATQIVKVLNSSNHSDFYQFDGIEVKYQDIQGISPQGTVGRLLWTFPRRINQQLEKPRVIYKTFLIYSLISWVFENYLQFSKKEISLKAIFHRHFRSKNFMFWEMFRFSMGKFLRFSPLSSK